MDRKNLFLLLGVLFLIVVLIVVIFFTFFKHTPSPNPSPEENNSISLPDDLYKYYIRDSLGNSVAWLGDSGNIILKGKCFSSGSCDNPGEDSFIIRNLANNNVAFINSTGDLCVESGKCDDENANCDSPPDGSFIIKDSSNKNVIYINKNGNLCLTGKVYENANP